VERSTTASRLRVMPQRDAAFTHLSLGGLRAHRRTLGAEEGRVSYWRRIVQARMDLVQSVLDGQRPDVDALRGVLAEDRPGSGRLARIEVSPMDDFPPLPDLAQLWRRHPIDGDVVHNRALASDLAKAERQLSAYRTALHSRLAAATNELIARYREDPLLCLSALPSQAGAGRVAHG
jgi:hypothetical protein